MKFARLVVFLLLITVIVGCSNSNENGEDSAGKVEIKFLHKWPQPEFNPYFEAVIKEFEAQNPDIKIKAEAVADEPMKDKLRVIMGGGDVPDIAFSWSGEFARKFVRSGAALDLTEYLNDDPEWRESFIPASLQPFESEGKNYGVPLRFNGKFFVYNKDLFEKYNLSEPTTWDEFLETLEVLKDAGEVPIMLGNASPWASIHYLTGLNQKIVDEETLRKDYEPKTGEFTDPGYVTALEYLKELADKGYLYENANSSSHDMASQQFLVGQGAMMYFELEEFQMVNDGMQDNWGFFKLPDIAEGKGNQDYLTGAPDGFIVSSKSKHPEEAIKFLKFLTSKENAVKMSEELGWPSPVDGATNPDSALPQVADAVASMKDAEGMAEWLDTDVHAKVADVYLSNIQLLLDGTKTPEEVMKEVQAVAKEVQSEVE